MKKMYIDIIISFSRHSTFAAATELEAAAITQAVVVDITIIVEEATMAVVEVAASFLAAGEGLLE